MKGRVRMIAALATAMLLATTMVYVALAADEVQEPVLQAAELVSDRDTAMGDTVQVDGIAVGPVDGEIGDEIEFGIAPNDGRADAEELVTRVRYSGSVPDAFRVGRNVILKGTLVRQPDGEHVFEAVPGTLVTKCPSKFEAEGDEHPADVPRDDEAA